MKHLIGVDIGGTNIVYGLLDMDGNVLRIAKQPTESEKGSDYVIGKIAEQIVSVLKEHNLDLSSIAAVGVGTPGAVNPETGFCIKNANLGWRDVPVADLLMSRVKCPVFIDNDVRMYVYGEAMKGAGVGCRNVLGVTIGTGIASAMVNQGRIYYGEAFAAGELGHVPMDGLTDTCKCGGIGCLETAVSAPGIARQAKQAIQAGKHSILGDWFTDASQITAHDVSKAYDLGDSVAIEIMTRTGKLLARALSFAIPLLSPDLLMIGGGAALAGDRLLLPMKDELQRMVRPMYWSRLAIRTAQWNDEAGVIGSALFAKQRLG